MTKWPVQKPTHRTTQKHVEHHLRRNRHLEKTLQQRKRSTYFFKIVSDQMISQLTRFLLLRRCRHRSHIKYFRMTFIRYSFFNLNNRHFKQLIITIISCTVSTFTCSCDKRSYQRKFILFIKSFTSGSRTSSVIASYLTLTVYSF